MSTPLVFIAESVKRITELAEIFGLSKPRQNLDPTIQWWNKLCQAQIDRLPQPIREHEPLQITIKFIKYKIGAFVAIGQDTPIPEEPFILPGDKPDSLIGGKWKMYIDRYIMSGPRKWEFLSSLKHIKSALPRPGAAMAKAAQAATEEKLTTEPRAFTTIEEEAKRFMIGQIRRTVKELFKGHNYTTMHQMRNFFPSTNANYINSRSKFGALATVLAEIRDLGLDNSTPTIRITKVDNDGDAIMREDEPGFSVIYDDSELQERYQILMHKLHEKAQKEVAHVTTVGLEEALKVRVITKGPPYTYTVLKPLQKFMHDILRKHPVFQLLGNPVPTEEMLYSQGMDELRPGEALNSGDYDDATNEMYSWTSEITVKQLAKELKLDDATKELFLKATIGHVFHGKDQLHGTLMGSIVNFIVLCIDNAALCRAVMEISERREIPLGDARLLINGDDCLFPLDERGRHLWEFYGNVMGLKVNRAKSFWSRAFCNINSRDFTLQRTNMPDIYNFHKVKFVNAGLMYGLKRSETTGVDTIADPKYTLGARARTLIDDAPFDLQHTLLTKFIEHHPQLFQTRLPWHLPEWAGGIGLPDIETEAEVDDPEPWKKTKYKRDLDGLKYLMLNWQEEQPKALHDVAQLDVHEYVQERLKPYVTQLKFGAGVVGRRNDNIYDTLYKLLCIEWLFTKAKGGEVAGIDLLLYLESPENIRPQLPGAREALRHNEKIWERILKKPNLPAADARTWDVFKSHMKRLDFIMGKREMIKLEL
jgi:hypothetical protein